MDCEKIISLIEKHVALWDMGDKLHYRQDIQRKLWTKIADEIGAQELSEEWMLAKSQDSELDFVKPVEGITFTVRMLGKIKVELANNEKTTAKAVQDILNMSKVKKCKPKYVNMRISLEGILVNDASCDTPLLDVSIYRISYCSADATHGHVFAFIATNRDDQLECHAFMCPKRKMAQLVSITVAQSFNTAHHLWQLTQKNHANTNEYFTGKSKDFQTISNTQIDDNNELIDLSQTVNNKHTNTSNAWARFDDEDEL